MYVVDKNSKGKQGGPQERTPLGPQHSASYDTLPPPCVAPLPPRPVDPGHPGGACEADYYQRDSSPPNFFPRTALIVILVFQFVAWIFYYDLPARVTLHNETMARMRMQEEALKEETKNMRIERIAFQDERQMLEAERLALKKERERLEKARYEIDAPKGAFWDPIWPVWECRSYGGREYWGVLRNIPNSWDHMDACMNMPVTIEGVTIRRPDRCQYEGDAMRAFWMVDWGQVNCKPWLQDIDDRVSLGKP